MAIEQIIGKRIKSLREEYSMTQQELSRRINLDPGNLSKIEKGKVLTTIKTIAKICETFRISIGEFFNISLIEESSDRNAILTEIISGLREKDIEQLKLVHTIVKSIK